MTWLTTPRAMPGRCAGGDGGGQHARHPGRRRSGAAFRAAGNTALLGRPRPAGDTALQQALAARGAVEAAAGQRRQLPGSVGRGQHLLAHRRRGVGGAGQAEPGRGLAVPAHLGLARSAVLEVTFEAVPVSLAEGIQGVAAGEQVQVVVNGLHHSTPRQSRILIMPSRIRVFTVPSAAPSSCATCG